MYKKFLYSHICMIRSQIVRVSTDPIYYSLNDLTRMISQCPGGYGEIPDTLSVECLVCRMARQAREAEERKEKKS